MKLHSLLPIVLLAGCSVSDYCLSLAYEAPSHLDACSAAFWKEYKECFGDVSYGTGCTLLVGEKAPAKCYPQNCQ